ncbi:hypothetical protein GGH95_000431 [Coemansia sp. RSA 1836]|nr:hypothetical protein GGH95_000431 [Coemansia sp. RSA 1836]
MSSLSPFQLLPLHVVEIVVDHIAGSKRRIHAGHGSPEEQAELQMPLLWVCRNFRNVVYSRFCRDYELTLDGDKGTVDFARPSWPDSLEQASHQTQHLAKELQIELDIWNIYSGKSLDMLSRAPYDTLIFPLVRSLAFFFVSPSQRKPKLTVLKDMVVANIDAFVQRIRRMVPMASEIKVETGSYSHDVHPNLSHYFSSLVSQLYQHPGRVVRCSLNCAVPYWQQQELTRIIVQPSNLDYNTSESIMQLARQNALTLHTLDLALEVDDIACLIQDTNGGHVSYPRLHVLRLTVLSEANDEQLPTFADAEPFPALQHLRISDQYPFGDETPLRGNAATLESLDVCIGAESVETFNSHKVFTPASHPKLCSVKLELAHGLVSEKFGSDDACMRFILGIGSGAFVRTITSSDPDQGLSTALPLLHDCTSIQVLELPNTDVNFWDAIELIKALPVLSDLRTVAPQIGPIPTGTTLAKLPEYVLSNYAAINERLRCWNLNMTRGSRFVEMSRCALLMALICPSLDFVLPPPARHDSFMTQMRKLVATKAFAQHAQRLQRLLIDG